MLTMVQSVAGDHLELRTTNGAIIGQFNTTADLDLHATNGYALCLFLPPHDLRSSSPPRFLPQTHRRQGLAPPQLHLAGRERRPVPRHGHGLNEYINLAFVDAPLDHALTASAQTSNGHVSVAVHDTFEGSFDLSTVNANLPSLMAHNARDPAGLGRRRRHAIHGAGRSTLYGNVWWSEENKERGSVSVSTSNWGVVLQI